MTQTTTELLNAIRERGSEVLLDALELMQKLDALLSSGEPLPDQWRGNSDRDVVDAWWMAEEGRKISCRHKRDGAVTLPCVTLSHVWEISFVTKQFAGKSLDEAYRLAAEWVRSQQP